MKRERHSSQGEKCIIIPNPQWKEVVGGIRWREGVGWGHISQGVQRQQNRHIQLRGKTFHKASSARMFDKELLQRQFGEGFNYFYLAGSVLLTENVFWFHLF